MSIFIFIVGIILFIGLIIVHELGHFLVARRNGVEAEEFGIFFPPRLYKKTITPRTKNWFGRPKPKSATKPFLFTINLLPLGGFVRMKGEHDSDTKPGSFGAASLWSKTKIMAAGVVMNYLTAVVLLTILAAVGIPKLIPSQFTIASDTKITKNEIISVYIEPDSPAAKAGLETDDRILSLGPTGHEQKLASSEQLSQLTQQYSGQEVNLVYDRAGEITTKQIHLRSDEQIKGTNHGHLGVEPTSFTLTRSTWSSPIVAVGLTVQMTKLTFVGLGHALQGLGGIIAGFVSGNHAARESAQTEASSQVSGPVGIFYILKSGSVLGWQFMLMIIAVISLTLAIMNVLPIPALDGGRLWFTLVSRAIKKPMSAKFEERATITGFLILICLIVLVTVVDVSRF
jgi:regulator of sigma E protease